MKSKQRTAKKYLTKIGFVFLVIIAIGLLYIGKLADEIMVDRIPFFDNGSLSTKLTPTPDPSKPKNILILGYGGDDHEGGYLTDTMIVAHILPKDRKVVLITIPRDLWVEVNYNDKPEHLKINHAYSVGIDTDKFPKKLDRFQGEAGGGRLAMQTVEKVTGLPIDGFVSVNFQGFQKIVDILGGVEVYVPYTFDDDFYPLKGQEDNPCGKTPEEVQALTDTLDGEQLERQFTCRYEKLHFDQGLQTMDATTALKFVRSRHSNVGGGDFGRSQRQLAFIEGVKDELLSFRSIFSLVPVLNQLSENVRTNLDIKSALSLIKTNGDLSEVDISAVTLTDENVLKGTVSEDGQYILIPAKGIDNWEGIHEYIQKEIQAN